MTRLSDAINELCAALTEACGGSEQAAGGSSAITIMLEKTLHFKGIENRGVQLRPGAYRVDTRSDGHLQLTSPFYPAAEPILATFTGHEFELTAPLALLIPVADDEQHIMLCFPGGGALHAVGGSRNEVETPVSSVGPLLPSGPSIFGALMNKFPHGAIAYSPSNKFVPPFSMGKVLKTKNAVWVANIEPGGPISIPGPFGGSQPSPIYWERSDFIGGDGPYGPGDEFPRSSLGDCLYFTLPVTITTSVNLKDYFVILTVLNVVKTVTEENSPDGWPSAPFVHKGPHTVVKDYYEPKLINPATPKTFTFTGVIVATGQVVGKHIPGGGWDHEVQKWFTYGKSGYPAGNGVQLDFELLMDGFSVATKSYTFNANCDGPFPLITPT